MAFSMRRFSKRMPDDLETTGSSGGAPLMAQNIATQHTPSRVEGPSCACIGGLTDERGDGGGGAGGDAGERG